MKLKSWQRILLWLAAFKIAYLGLLCAAVWLWPDFDEARANTVKRVWVKTDDPQSPQKDDFKFARHFATWDAAHYLLLSELGYSKGLRSCAFYPLWPLFVRWFSVFTGGSHLVAGMVLANLFSLAGWTLFYSVTAKRFGESAAQLALVLLVAFPGSLFYQFIYTEPLFFLLVMALWFGLERQRYGVAMVAAFLLPLTRAVGVFSVLPIAWVFLQQMRNGECGARNDGVFAPSADQRRSKAGVLPSLFHPPSSIFSLLPSRLALLAMPPLGLALYFGLMWNWTGNPFEGMEAQKYWGAHSISNLWNVPKFVMGFFEPTTWHAFKGSVLDRCAFLLLLYCLPLIWRLGKDLVVWTYVLGILPAMSGTFVSFTRFESTAFPLFIALAVFLSGRKARWPLIGFLTAMSVLHLILLWRFVNYRWAG